ncbi:MAG: bifunctional 5,10-methylenetetrahydrofolate dehydrogenase/5,10-methenyltetrahydrofolate cyclohydrolase [Candidatus ainarchaeum sp.]|nr:bifunctional 5,10-methylenetetrahydrofolate dehydrogenase/5,10-methenyltetrahydrofolate cyclohydrolase [Candidatus ainarchaeum sp.]
MILSGKALAAEIEEGLKKRVDALGFTPGLDIVMVGDDPASRTYVEKKLNKAGDIGIRGRLHHLSESTTEEELLSLIGKLDADKSVHGFIVQLPLPKQINPLKIIAAIDARKDADGLHPLNLGMLAQGSPATVSATPKGIMRLIDYYKIQVAGAEAVVVGRSGMVGKPISYLLTNRNATVTLCHSKTKNLAEHTRKADILVVAVGSPYLIKSDMVKEGANIIDVGTTKLGAKMVGDVDFDPVSRKASVTPVPGGVGPLTVMMLMENLVELAERAKAEPQATAPPRRRRKQA